MNRKIKGHEFNAAESGKKDFMSKVQQQPLFSSQDYFNTVFLGGEAIIK
jgi:hypothetical protein